MPAVVVDSVVVTGGWDPSALERGLQASSARLEQFVASVANTRVGVRFELVGADQALQQARQLSGALSADAFVEFGHAADAALAPLTNGAAKAAAAARLLADLPTPKLNVGPAVQAAEQLAAANGHAAASAELLAQAQARVATQPRDVGGRFTAVDVSPKLAEAANQATVLQAALARTTEATVALAKAAAAPLTLPTGPSVASLEALQGTIGATVRQVQDARQLLSQPLVAPPIVVPPPTITPPDLTLVLQEVARAAAIVQQEFAGAVSAVRLGPEWAAGVRGAVAELQATLQSRLGAIQAQFAAGLFPTTAAATAAADEALAAFSREVAARQAAIPELVLRARRGAAQDAGVITDADLARVGEFDSVAATASRSADRLAAATTRSRAALEGHGRAALAARSSLTVLASQALGTSSTLGRLAESVLLFGGGSAVVIGVAAAVLAAAKAFEAVTEQARKAKEETDKAVASLLKLHEAQRDPVRVRLEETGQVSARLEDIRKRIAALVAQQRELERAPPIQAGRFGPQTATSLSQVSGLLLKLAREFVDLSTAAGTGGLAVATAQADQLVTALKLGTASLEDFAAASAAIARFNVLAADSTKDLSVQNDARQKANALIEATQAPLLRQLELQQRTTQEAISAIAAADALAKAQAQVAAGPGFAQLIQQYRDLEAAAAGDVEQVQRLADKRHELEKLRQATDDAVKAFANIGGGATAKPVLQFQTQFDFADTDKALADLLAELQRRATNQPIVVELAPLASTRATLLAPTVNSSFEQATAATGDLQQALEQAIAAANRFGATAIRNANDARTAQQRLNDAIHDVTRGMDSIIGAARNVGLIGDEAARSLGSVLDLADAVGNLKDELGNITAGGALGLIGAGIGVLGSLVGKSPGELERDRILAQNNRLLDGLRASNEALRASLDRQVQGAAGVARGQTAAAAAAADRIIQSPSKIDVISHAPQRELDRILAEAGLSVEGFTKILKDTTGLDVLDSKGRIIAKTLAQANEALQLYIQSITHLGTGISAQQTTLEAQDKLGIGPRVGFDPDQQRLERVRQLELDNLKLDAAEEARVRALDLGTARGRAAFLEEQRALERRVEAGLITADQLEGFSSVTELQGVINDAAEAINAFTEQVHGAAAGFDAFRAELDLGARLRGEATDPAAAFQREIDALLATMGTAAPALAEQLAGLNLGDPEAVRQALLKLFTQFTTGGFDITADQLATLNGFLGDGASFLDTFNKQVQGAADRLGDLNIPAGFRRAFLAFQNASLGPTSPLTPTPVAPVFTPPAAPVIAPLPDDVQALLDTIATKTPGDLLSALQGVTQAASTAPARLVDLLDAVRVATTDGPQRLLDAVNAVTAAIQATQTPPTEAGAAPSRTAPTPTPTSSPAIRIGPGGSLLTIIQRPGESADALSDRIVSRLERLGVLQTGNTQAFGPF